MSATEIFISNNVKVGKFQWLCSSSPKKILRKEFFPLTLSFVASSEVKNCFRRKFCRQRAYRPVPICLVHHILVTSPITYRNQFVGPFSIMHSMCISYTYMDSSLLLIYIGLFFSLYPIYRDVRVYRCVYCSFSFPSFSLFVLLSYLVFSQ